MLSERGGSGSRHLQRRLFCASTVYFPNKQITEKRLKPAAPLRGCEIPPQLLPYGQAMRGSLFCQAYEMPQDTGHSGHPFLPPGRSVPEPCGTASAIPSHHWQRQICRRQKQMLLLLKYPRPRAAKGGGNATGSLALSDRNRLHVHPGIFSFIQLLIGWSGAR